MKTATAWSGRAGERSAHKIAEKMAKSAGVDFDAWIAEAVAEYAEDLGVHPDDLNERERLEAIEERVDRLAGAASRRSEPRDESRSRRPEPRAAFDAEDARPSQEAPRRSAPRREAEPDPLEAAIQRIEKRAAPAPAREPQGAAEDAPRNERGRLESAMLDLEKRAERTEQRTARALESLSGIIEARGEERGKLELTIREIEKRAERNEERTARALESLTGIVEARGEERGLLEQTIREIEKRAARNEERTAQSLQSLHGLIESRVGDRDRLQQAIAEVEARAEKNAERTARALESLSGMVEARKGERDRLEAAIERIGKRAEQSEARTARALESLTTLVQPAPERPAATPPRVDTVAARFDELSRRAALPPDAPDVAILSRGRAEPSVAADDDETFRLVAERLSRRRKQRDEAKATPAAAPARSDDAPVRDPALAPVEAKLEEIAKALGANDVGATVNNMQRELRRLADKVETLSTAPDAARGQARDAEAAREKASAVERLERQIGGLVERVERLSDASPASADIAQALKTLADAHAEIERGAPAAALQAVERRLAELGARIDASARRPALDTRPLEELARRVEAIRATIERQGASRPDSAVLATALQSLNDKFERASATGSQSAATLSTLQGMVSRLEETLRRPTAVSLDARPLEDLSRRIEGVRGLVERQGGLTPKVDKLNAAVGELAHKLDRPAPGAAEIERIERTMRDLAVQVETALGRSAVIDPKPVEDLAQRIEAVRNAVESNATLSPQVARLENGLADIRARLDRPTESPQIEAVDATLRKLAAKFEEAVNRPAPVIDAKPIEELSRRIDGVKGAVERQDKFAPHAARLEAGLREIRAKLDKPFEIESVDAALRQLASRVDEAVSRPAPAPDPKPIEDLARRIDGVKGAVDRQERFAPHAARLEAALRDIRAKLDKPSEIEGVDAALRLLAARVEEAVNRPMSVALDPQPIEELARRIEGVKSILERQDKFAPHAARLEAALGDIRAKLDRPSEIEGVDAALRQLASRVEEAVSRPVSVAVDSKPIEELARRIESVKSILERQDKFAPHAARLEAALGDIRAKLDRPSEIEGVDAALRELAARVDEAIKRPTVALDPKPLEELSRRIDSVKAAVEGQERFGAHAARLEAGLREIRGKLDKAAQADGVDAALRQLASRVEEAVNRPTTVALDPKPIEDLARRIESVRASLDRPSALAPQVERLETALGAVADKLDRATPVDASGLNTTLAEMNARLEEAFRRAPSTEINREPIDALARRVRGGARIDRTAGGEDRRRRSPAR